VSAEEVEPTPPAEPTEDPCFTESSEDAALDRVCQFLKCPRYLGPGHQSQSVAIHQQYISNTQAISYRASMYGVDEPYHYISNANIGLTYRQN